MIIRPTPRETHNGAQPTLTVTTRLPERVLKPEADPDAFEDAAALALAEAQENGFEAIAYESVVEFITGDGRRPEVKAWDGKVILARVGCLMFEYVWTFTLWREDDEAEPAG